MPVPVTAAFIRGEIARRWDQPLYQLAARVSIHPVALSAVLNERHPLKPELAEKILAVLHSESEEVHGR